MGDEGAKSTDEADALENGDSADTTPAPAQEVTNTASPPKAQEPPAAETTTNAKRDEANHEEDKATGPLKPVKMDEKDKKALPADENTAATDEDPDDPASKSSRSGTVGKLVPIVASSKKSRPPYRYDPNKISLRFIFANRDGLTVTVDCNPSDTVGEVKGALLSVWPEDLPACDGGEYLRLICMGKGFLMPDTRTLEDCQIPTFESHPTPINVSVRPNGHKGPGGETPSKSGGGSGGDPSSNNGANAGSQQTGQGCSCVIL